MKFYILICWALLFTKCDKNSGSSTEGINLPSDTLAVDLSTTQQQYTAYPRANGLLFGVTLKSPSNEWIKPLSLSAYRFNLKPENDVYDRIKNWDVHKQVILNASYGFPPWKFAPGRPGYNGDYSAWEDTVRNVVTRNMDRGWTGKNIEYDIWNEGDFHKYWDGSRYGLLETWVKGAKIIQQMDPDALIVGPSFAYYDLNGITKFLEYAQQNNVVPDIISWHENHTDPASIESHIAEYRASPNASLVSRIHINEYGWHEEAFIPGYLMHYIANLDRSQVEAAMRGSWGTDWGNNTLIDLLTDNLEPTPSWWVHKYYADMAMKDNTMVALDVKGENMDGLLSFHTDDGIYVLLGNKGSEPESIGLILQKYQEIISSIPSTAVISTLPNHRRALLEPASKSKSLKLNGNNIELKVSVPAKSAVFIRIN